MDVADSGAIVTSVTVPFDNAPPIFSCARFGAPVSKGKAVSARLADGSTINP